MITLERQQRVRRHLELFAADHPKKEHLLLAIDDLLEEIGYLENHKAGSNDLERLYLLTQEGFKRMDERFIALQKQMDERFIAMDKRFETLQKQMDSRFTQLQWLIGVMFAALSLFTSWLGTRQPAIDETKLQKSLTEAVSKGFQDAVQELKLRTK